MTSALFSLILAGHLASSEFQYFYLSLSYYYFLTVATLPRVQIDIKTRESLNKTIIVIDDEAWVGDEKCMNRTNPEEAMKLIE